MSAPKNLSICESERVLRTNRRGKVVSNDEIVDRRMDTNIFKDDTHQIPDEGDPFCNEDPEDLGI